ncbi:MAG: M56 family metallopeptidase [Bacteroidota bacterium]|nr:M56 family metallopeptidase [Bacteroidota bacterium]
MNINFVNIIESVVTLALFYFFYQSFLKKETFHQINRVYLITTLLFAVSVPFFHFNFDFGNISFLSFAKNSDIANTIASLKNGYNELGSVIIYGSASKFSWPYIREILELIYYCGVFLFALFFIAGLIRIIFLISFGKKVRYGRYSIIETKNSTVPFSLFKWIVINPDKYSSYDIKQVIAHEKIHAFQLHSLDLIIIEVIIILFWFNPFIYWYRKSIREVHEFLADEAVLKKGFDKLSYQQLLFKQASGSRFMGLTSSFSYSLSKNRLKMFTMMKSKNSSKIKLALAIPLAIAFMVFFTNSADFVNASNHTELVTIEQKDTVKIKNEEKKFSEDVYYKVEKMPKFQGKKSSHFRNFVTEHLNYPEKAVKDKLSGTVYVSFTIDKEGNLVDAEVIRGAHSLLDAEALRVTNLSPKWEPGENQGEKVNVRFTFPIIFSLDKKGQEQ